MPRIFLVSVLLTGFMAIGAGAPVGAQGYGPRGPGPDIGPAGHRAPPRHYGHAPARHLPPETRYRDPRYVPAPRAYAVPRHYAGPRAPRFETQPELIHAYLPRHTQLPMYNEPPSRFPQR